MRARTGRRRARRRHRRYSTGERGERGWKDAPAHHTLVWVVGEVGGGLTATKSTAALEDVVAENLRLRRTAGTPGSVLRRGCRGGRGATSAPLSPARGRPWRRRFEGHGELGFR